MTVVALGRATYNASLVHTIFRCCQVLLRPHFCQNARRYEPITFHNHVLSELLQLDKAKFFYVKVCLQLDKATLFSILGANLPVEHEHLKGTMADPFLRLRKINSNYCRT